MKSLVDKEGLFDETKWESVYRNKGIPKDFEIARVDIVLCEETFVQACVDSMKDDELPIIPIVSNNNNDNNGQEIEYIKMVKIEPLEFYIGVGIKYRVTNQLLYAFYLRYCRNDRIPQDVIALITKFCTVLEVSSIQFDLDYVYQHHRALPSSQQVINRMEIANYRPFITDLAFEDETDDDLIKC